MNTKTTLVIFLFPLTLFSCFSNPSNDPVVAKQLLELEREAITREFKNDTAFLSSIMDTSFIELARDKIKNKHEVLKTIHADNIANANNKIVRDSFVLEDPVVHVYDKTAVVTFIMHTYNKKDQIPFERRTRFYDVWVKRDNKWMAITWQGSAVE